MHFLTSSHFSLKTRGNSIFERNKKSVWNLLKQEDSQKIGETEQYKDFNKIVLEQKYYLEEVDVKGEKVYVKATRKALENLERKVKCFDIYQVKYKGKVIPVLAPGNRFSNEKKQSNLQI